MAETQKIWYFAYGANTNPKSLSLRRKVYPTESRPAFIPGLFLNFDTLGIPYLEPSFASIGNKRFHPSQPEVHGVVHEISLSDYKEIRRTEGGSGHEGVGYESVEVKVHCYDGKELSAFTLVQCPSPRHIYHSMFYPSKRYLELIAEGAEHFGVKPEYQNWLKTVPRYESSRTVRHIIGKFLYLSLVALCFLPLLPLVLVTGATRSRVPRWGFLVGNFIAHVLRHIYYFVFFPVFGPGAGEQYQSISNKNLPIKKENDIQNKVEPS